MKSYQYQILRFSYDKITEEFINVGIVLYAPKENYINIKTTNKYKRISDFYMISANKYFSAIKSVEKSLKDYIHKAELTDNLEFITNNVLSVDDSALQFSKTYCGITNDLDNLSEELYDRYVDRYNKSERKTLTDHDVWQKIFRPKFESIGLVKKLVKRTVKTEKDTFNFDYSWKNGVWHYYKPLTFDLSEQASIKDKVYKYVGISEELATTNEEFKLVYLVFLPKQHIDLSLIHI